MNKEIQDIKMNKKPVLLLKEDFVNNIYDLINNTELPFVIIEPVLRDVLNNVNIELKKQYEYEKQQYENTQVKSTGGKENI